MTDYNNDAEVKKLREKMASVIAEADQDLERIKTAEAQDLAAPEDLLTRTISGMADDLRAKSFPKEAEAIKEARQKTASAKTASETPVAPEKPEAPAAKEAKAEEPEAEDPAEEAPVKTAEHELFDFKSAFDNPAFVKGFNDYIEAHGPIWKQAALDLMVVPLS